MLYSGFAISNLELVTKTIDEVNCKLSGKYGYVRFLRDGYRTPIEDKNRLHYDPLELEQFDQIECQWPLFLCFQLINKVFQQHAMGGDMTDEIKLLEEQIGQILIYHETDSDFLPMMLMAYAVPSGRHVEGKRQPGTVQGEAVGHLPHISGQAFNIVARLLPENVVSPGEIDPLNRRLSTQKRPEIVEQVAVLAANDMVKQKLGKLGWIFF